MGSTSTRWLTGIGLALALVAAVLLMHGASPSPGSTHPGHDEATSSLAVPAMPDMPHGDDGGGCGVLLACCLAVVAGVALLVLPRAGLGPASPPQVTRPRPGPPRPVPPRPPALCSLGVLRI